MTSWQRRSLLAVFMAAVVATPALAADPLKVGAYPANPPWEYKTPAGTFEGFEVDVVNDVAKRLSTTADFQDFGFQALFAGISSGRINMAISSITITPERLKNQAFTQPYYDSDGAILTKADSPVSTMEALKGKTLGVIASSSGEAWLKKNGAAMGLTDVKSYNSQDNLMLDVKNGRVEGGVGEVAGFQYAMSKTPGYRIAVRIPTGEHFAIMLKKGSPLLQPVNDAITAMKKDGTLAAIHKKWFGTAADAGSSTLTAMPIPAE
ncbi:ABC transporter substrate-binding protein [Lichenifustis flavocetrariae]|uniref:ABC transporter substrate-binding protein n=1 Tax=Lichenifustis flavocetrariae TaxID=2949735 RepID=A0AA41YZL5_9HYPH|nr:ABC transporter substrate-binding protein [Lichenifustis flavocetrariae]MCW6510018.1 ABC transporter substrate-binding protein [Lichenifustis flavocetrariae]